MSTLLAEWAVRESVHFSHSPADRFTYALQLSPAVSEPCASYTQGDLAITLPIVLAVHWASSDTISIEHTQATGDAMELRILVEKDFRCLQPRATEEETDNFPNPNPASCGPPEAI
ncbi:MAG TPA: hypothetical protein VGN39_13130 [Terriglobales bacterium]|nr:hypothetical protein [Terriglobales bacterium]